MLQSVVFDCKCVLVSKYNFDFNSFQNRLFIKRVKKGKGAARVKRKLRYRAIRVKRKA